MQSGTKSDGSLGTRRATTLGRAVALLSNIIRWWALAGGALTTALAVLTTISAVLNILFKTPLAADYELAKHFIAIAIFTFLPYCQLVGANVTVDIFTERLGEKKKAAMVVLSSLLAFAFALLLLSQMSQGMASYVRYPEVTPVLKLPLWTAFPPILFSLLLLAIAALITAVDGVRTMRGLPPLGPARSQQPTE